MTGLYFNLHFEARITCCYIYLRHTKINNNICLLFSKHWVLRNEKLLTLLMMCTQITLRTNNYSSNDKFKLLGLRHRQHWRCTTRWCNKAAVAMATLSTDYAGHSKCPDQSITSKTLQNHRSIHMSFPQNRFPVAKQRTLGVAGADRTLFPTLRKWKRPLDTTPDHETKKRSPWTIIS